MRSTKDILTTLPIFSSLDSNEIDQISQVSKTQSFKENQIIFKEGELDATLYVVLEGGVRISTVVENEIDKPLVTVRTGGAFGEVSLIDRNPRESRATVVEDSRLLSIDAASFEKLAEENPQLGTKIYKFLTRSVVDRIRIITDQYRRNIQWSLSVSGALKMNWKQLVTDEIDISLELIGGKVIQGNFVKVEERSSLVEFFVRDRQDKILVVPYHAILSVAFNRIDTREASPKSKD